MSDREMRRLLNDVIDDIEAGRVKPRRRLGRLGALLGGGAIAATMALAGCDTNPAPAYGVPPDATVKYDAEVDAGPTTEYGGPEVDAGPTTEYGGPDIDAGPEVDAGPVVDYGGPDIDAGPMVEYGGPDVDAGPMVDAGPVVDYGVPDIDAGPVVEYGSP